MLIRDRPALEVLMLRRTPHAVFSPGASVFPGGAVDADDAGPAVQRRVTGADDAWVSAEMSLPRGPAVKVAAVRECFEEAGLLVARDRATSAPVELTDPTRRDRLAHRRTDLNAGRVTWREVLDAEDVVIDVRDLHVFAHWRTPIGAPRRYDTWFFVAVAPHGDDGVHDDQELVASEWIAPDDALGRNASGDIDLIFPTMRSLTILSRFERVHDVLAALDAVERDEHGRLAVVADGGGERVALDGDGPITFGWKVPLPDIRRAIAREGVA